MYVTPAHLADGSDSLKELSELYGVDAPLLAAVIAGGDTGAWPADDVAAASEALASIQRFIVQADGEVDARLAQRGYPLPQDAAQFPILTVWARAIARYHLHRQRDKTSEETGRIERDYRDALRALDQVAAGKLSLGVNDPLAPAPADPDDPGTGSTRLISNERMFSRKTLGAL
ncbi:phage protein Gp36 family protein [Pseudoxanthomonas mexicana]|uniref:phage protein Gp36 family protein n=1 Tax=Pseudoxanthomonas mexicana TaxID=128785 RepID=UPI00398B94AB